MNEDIRNAKRYASAAATGHVSTMRQVCRETDPNGNFDDATEAELISILCQWALLCVESHCG